MGTEPVGLGVELRDMMKMCSRLSEVWPMGSARSTTTQETPRSVPCHCSCILPLCYATYVMHVMHAMPCILPQCNTCYRVLSCTNTAQESPRSVLCHCSCVVYLCMLPLRYAIHATYAICNMPCHAYFRCAIRGACSLTHSLTQL